jgi:hypothetical protein
MYTYFEYGVVYMNLGKYFNIETKKNDGKLRELLIIAAFAIILLGFGNGFHGRYELYENGNGFDSPAVMPKKKRHKHHRPAIDDFKTPPKTAVVETEPQAEKSMNSDEVPYIVQ